MTILELNKLLSNSEGCNVEFKSARNNFNEHKELVDYCAAIANEGGGYLVLGIDNATHQVLGTTVYVTTLHTLEHVILEHIGIRVHAEELQHPDGRVVIFSIPSKSRGCAVSSNGKYLMRAGSSLVPMDSETLKLILNENEPDWSTQIVEGAAIEGLDRDAINELRNKWARKADRSEIEKYSDEKILKSLELVTVNGITNAAIVLTAKKELMGKVLPCAEIIFEWRQEASKIPYDFRKEWREPFVLIYDQIWQTVNQRNLRFPFQEGFIQREIFAFTELPIREAILNAVTHRDYTITSQSIFIKASPDSFVIQSPGGLVNPVTLDTILTRSAWRNRRIAEVFQKVGLVERSGQGMDQIFDNTIREGKGLPDLKGTDAQCVFLTIPAKVQDPKFILFLEKLINERQLRLSFEEIYELEHIRQKRTVTNTRFKQKFLEYRIIEKIGRTRDAKYILSHRYYQYEGKPGVYTRLVGITREEQKLLLLKHLEMNSGKSRGFADSISALKESDVSNLLQELKKSGKIRFIGSKKNGYWEAVK